MSNREKAAEIVYIYGETTFEKSLLTARALSAEGVLDPESAAELVRLRRELEEFIGELHEDLAHEGIENYEDISDAWPSMQEYGELVVKLAHRNILTRILEGHSDE